MLDARPYELVTIVAAIICTFLAVITAANYLDLAISIVIAFAWLLFSIMINRQIVHATSGQYEKELEDWANSTRNESNAQQ